MGDSQLTIPAADVLFPPDYSARIILDSISEAGVRLTTLELNMPRFLLAQLNTHRAFSRNAASSRAIPTAKLIDRVREQPFVPAEFGVNQRGMQAGNVLAYSDEAEAHRLWLAAADAACRVAASLAGLGLHKQWANRLLEPFLWVKVLVTATDWANFFRLRRHEDAQPEFQRVAQLIFAAREASQPERIVSGAWHMPYVDPQSPGQEQADLRALSVARCARLGLPKDGEIGYDLELYERLLTGSGFGHWSPFEHVATPLPAEGRDKNFRGWRQYRSEFPQECAPEGS